MNNKCENLNLTEKDKLNHDLEVWKVALDTQMHFNDLIIKMRTAVISINLGVFGTAAICLRDSTLRVDFLGSHHISFVVLMVGLFFLIGQGIIDYFYYFKLLLGSVKFTESIDNKYKENDLFGLTNSISKEINPCWSKFILFVYYIIPIALFISALLIIHFKIQFKVCP